MNTAVAAGDGTAQCRAFVSGDQHTDESCVRSCLVTDGQGLTHQAFGTLLQGCSVFDAAGSDNGRLDHAMGVTPERLVSAGADRFEKAFLTPGGIQMRDAGPLAFANSLMKPVLNKAEAATGVCLPGIETCEQLHDLPGRLTRVARANQPMS